MPNYLIIVQLHTVRSSRLVSYIIEKNNEEKREIIILMELYFESVLFGIILRKDWLLMLNEKNGA